VKALARRLARLESVSHALEDALVSPETLQRMAAVSEAECARIREKLLGNGPLVPAVGHRGIESDSRRMLREKLLRDDSATADSARA
jgi:hypothetical protein